MQDYKQDYRTHMRNEYKWNESLTAFEVAKRAAKDMATVKGHVIKGRWQYTEDGMAALQWCERCGGYLYVELTFPHAVYGNVACLLSECAGPDPDHAWCHWWPELQ